MNSAKDNIYLDEQELSTLLRHRYSAFMYPAKSTYTPTWKHVQRLTELGLMEESDRFLRVYSLTQNGVDHVEKVKRMPICREQ